MAGDWEASQPISAVRWVHAGTLRSNTYNPNNVSPNELDLLKTSLLEDGWTQPIVVTEDSEIVDGFHRWTLARSDAMVMAMTAGHVPVVTTRRSGEDERIASTIRHNRARGAHYIVRMAELVRALHDGYGLAPERIQEMLGMEREEYERLYDRGGMPGVGGKAEFEKSWRPV